MLGLLCPTRSTRKPAMVSGLALKICQTGHGVGKVCLATRQSSMTNAHTCSVTKIKKDLIHKAKVKKAYAKIKAQEHAVQQEEHLRKGQDERQVEEEQHKTDQEEKEKKMHPTRQLMLMDEGKAQAGITAQEEDGPAQPVGHRRRTRRPGYYDKQLEKAEERRADAEQRAQEAQRRREERERKLAQREKSRKAMAKTRGRDGKKKLGRESGLLLDKVRKMVADGG